MSPSYCNSWLSIKCFIFHIKNILFYPLLNNNKNQWHLRQENSSSIFPESKSTFFFLHAYVFFTHNHTNRFHQEKGEKSRTYLILKIMDNFTHAKKKCALRFGAVLVTYRAKRSDNWLPKTDYKEIDMLFP